jgi:hypothetical protein
MLSEILAGIGGGGLPIVNDALLLTKPAVAEISTSESFPAASAVKVTVATPDPLVIAVVAGVKFPAPGTLAEKVTVAPLIGADTASRTVADTVVLPKLAMVDVPSDMVHVVGTWGGVPIVIGSLSLIVPAPTVTVARMVAVVFGVTAVNWLVATPDASVTSVVGLSEPVTALITVKATLTFGTTTELASLTTAVTEVDPPFAMAAAPSVT